MTLVRWDPFRELENMSDRLNQMLMRPLGLERPAAGELLTGFDWTPACDIEENDKEYLVKAELPEVKQGDVKVEVQNGVLTIEGERRQEKQEKGLRFHRVERAYGKFCRTFTLPTDIDETKMTAEFRNGVLDVHVPKTRTTKTKATHIPVAFE